MTCQNCTRVRPGHWECSDCGKTPNPVFYRKDGELSGYALACGHVVSKPMKHHTGEVQLYREHGCFHVRRLFRDGPTQNALRDWRVTKSRKEADKMLKAFVKEKVTE